MMRKSLMLLGMFVAVGVLGLASAGPSEGEDSCYWSTDGVRYNHFSLRLRPDGGYRFVLHGDIGIWGTSSGRWSRSGDVLHLVQAANDGSIQFPDKLRVKPDDSLELNYSGHGYSEGGTDLLESKCENEP